MYFATLLGLFLGTLFGFFFGRCRFLASRCGLARFLQKVSFFLRFKPGLLGIRLLATVVQWSMRKTTVFVDSIRPCFTSLHPAPESLVFYSTFRVHFSKTTVKDDSNSKLWPLILQFELFVRVL